MSAKQSVATYMKSHGISPCSLSKSVSKPGTTALLLQEDTVHLTPTAINMLQSFRDVTPNLFWFSDSSKHISNKIGVDMCCFPLSDFKTQHELLNKETKESQFVIIVDLRDANAYNALAYVSTMLLCKFNCSLLCILHTKNIHILNQKTYSRFDIVCTPYIANLHQRMFVHNRFRCKIDDFESHMQVCRQHDVYLVDNKTVHNRPLSYFYESETPNCHNADVCDVPCDSSVLVQDSLKTDTNNHFANYAE